jgi:hypothetical protein
MRELVTIKFRAAGSRHLLLALLLASVAIPLLGESAYAQSYVDPSFGVGDSIIRSDVFVGDKQGRVPATEGQFTDQLSGWLNGAGEVLHGEVVHVGRGCNSDTNLANPAGKIALIERGVCTFVEKITKAYSNGAIGAIVYNNVRTPPDNEEILIRMGPANPGQVPIPGFFVARSSGLALRATPVNVKIQAASFRALMDGVSALVNDGTLTNKQAGSLKDKISAASDAANKGNFATALNLISAFRAEILALKTAGVLPASDWQGLDDAAGVIVTRLQPPFTDSAS